MMIRRISVLTAIFLALFSVNAIASQFCEGFKAGYITGYKQAANSSIRPITPICPIMPIKGFGDPESDYEFGYTKGYQKGVADGSR